MPDLCRKVLRYLLLGLGLLTLTLLVWHIGIGNIYDAARNLGPTALVVILMPSVIMYILEAYGWRMTLGPSAQTVPFWKILAIRTAGEVVNMTTPTAYVGGEPLKAYLSGQPCIHYAWTVEEHWSRTVTTTETDSKGNSRT